MIPELGPECDLCTPDVHYLLKCPKCEQEWDAPCSPGAFTCPCGEVVLVTHDNHQVWLKKFGLT